jgi:hypothetical protein
MQRTLSAQMDRYTAKLWLRRYNLSVDGGLWYGASELPNSRPKWVVYKLEVRYRNRVVPIGRGAYADLSEVNQILFFKNRRGEIVLKIEGGDAADSYNAFLVFREGALIRRRVESGEFPRNFYEETQYVNIPVKD